MNVLSFVTLVWVLSSAVAAEANFTIHHDHPATIALLHAVHEKCPDITRVYSLSERSVQGRDLVVIEMTKDPGKHVPMKPEFRYVGNMHGNEVVGKEMLLRLIVYLCDQYLQGSNLVSFLLSHTRIHIMPTLNPDGWHKAYDEYQKTGKVGWITGRNNSNDVDLNRNFPDLDKIVFASDKTGHAPTDHLMKLDKALRLYHDLQPETRAMMRWMSEVDFVLASNLHGGDLVANYPYDEANPLTHHASSPTPDDATFIQLAKSYSYFHGKMSDSEHKLCGFEDRFKDGITNGAQWYSVSRGMQDYSYLETNCFEVTLELGCDKFPPPSRLPDYWHDNHLALLNFILQSHMGIKGMIKSRSGRPVFGARIQVTDLTRGLIDGVIKHDILSLKDGDYYRLLNDGIYKITVSAHGFHPTSKCVTVKNSIHVGSRLTQTAQEVNFVLTPTTTERDGEDERELRTCHQLRLTADKSGDTTSNVGHIGSKKTEIQERRLLDLVLQSLAGDGRSITQTHSLSLPQLYLLVSLKLHTLPPHTQRDVLHLLPASVRAKLSK